VSVINSRWWPASAALFAVVAWLLFALLSPSLTWAEGVARGLLVGVVVGVAARESQRWRHRVHAEWESRAVASVTPRFSTR
jgi:hypothetical protein